MYLLIIITICLNLCLINCESDCDKFSTCGTCIGYASDVCVWCPADYHKGVRCKSKNESEKRSWCSADIVDPKFEFTSISDNEFSSGGDKGAKVVQFKPQSLRIKTRPGVPVNITMAYKPAKDFPVDIYYLMDYSATMVQHAATLRNQGLDIYKELTKLTNNVRLGVGSFVDKNSLPFSDGSRQVSYSFNNHLALTDNMDDFKKALSIAPYGANYDEPEASLDGLMQAMVCKTEVGWRDNARRIIVLSTDSTYHSAGDGKFVGAFQPHDMMCHMTNNKYTKELELDYPSVNQISKVAADNNFMIIFTVEEKVQLHYQALKKIIKGSKCVPLKIKSNLVDVIKTEYLSLIRNVQLDYNIPPFIEFKLDQDCSKKGECELQHKESLQLTGTLTVKSCPPNEMYNQVVQIGPLMLNERLEIQLEIDCQCDCEKPEKAQINSDMCDNSGTYQCGVCKCNANRKGSECQCDGTSEEKVDEDGCRYNNESLLCSGHGSCSCGKCDPCSPGYWGSYCERDNTACLGLTCSDHGECDEGACICSEGWNGKYCDCSLKKDSCITPYSGKECSGNGKCDCGTCKCEICSGQFCDDCEEMATQNCKDLEDFAYCNLENSKEGCELKYNKINTDVKIVNKTEINSPEYYFAKYWCKKFLEDDRIFLFKYFYSTDKLLLIIQNELEEPPVAKIWITVGSLIGAILLIGIITLIAWKMLVDMHDKKEYEKFYNAATAAGYIEENPLYNSPATNFTNPAYVK